MTASEKQRNDDSADTPPPEPGASGTHGDGGDGLRSRLEEELAPDLEIIRSVDEGTTATIYLAREPALRRLVAVKVLSPELAGDDVARPRFEREARSAASIAHPNVVTVYRVGTLSDGHPYQVMEYVKGRSMAEHLEAMGPVATKEGCRILRSIASALEAAHRQHIVHRDVRPDNVLYEEDTGRALLADFGVAAVLASGSEAVERLTRTGELLGDVSYASPEQLQGDEPSEATDLYGLALFGYELFARRGPYDADTPQELAVAHLREEPRRLSELRADVPEGLDDVLWSCLAKNPKHRPTAGRVVQQLEAILEEEAGSRGGTGARAEDQRTRRGHRRGRETGEVAESRRDSADRAPAATSGAETTGPRTAARGTSGDTRRGVRGLYDELKRRHVFRVAIVYGAVAWVLVQVATSTFPHLELPDWTITLVIVLSIIAFPIVLIMAWAFEMTPEGMRRTPRREDEEHGPGGSRP